MRVFLLLTLVLLGTKEGALGQQRSSIWHGKGEFDLGKSVPGVIEIRGKNGFPVLKDGNGASLAAAGIAGKGRVVAFSHGSFVKSNATLEPKPVSDLWINLLKWAGLDSGELVGLHSSTSNLSKYLDRFDIRSKTISPADLTKEKPAIYCLFSDDKKLTDSDIAKITAFLSSGGGVIVATTPWAFTKNYPNFDLSPGNQILSKAGLYYHPRSYCSNKTPITISRPIETFLPAERTWENGVIPETNHPAVEAARQLAKGEKGNQTKLIADLRTGKQLSGYEIPAFLDALRNLNLKLGGITPTKQTPVVPGEKPLIDAVIELETHFNLTLPAGMMYPIPAATDYPGTCPPDAETIEKSIPLNCDFKGWAPQRNAGGWNAKEIRPTGVYALPGKPISVVVPDSIISKGYEVVIGSYGGGLRNRTKWHRYPRIQKAESIRDNETKVSNGFGGLVGIRVPQNAKDGIQQISITGGIAAPLYQHGKTDVSKWQQTISKHPAPWAEIASDRIIISVPSEHVRDLENPDELMALWNQIIDRSAELACLDRSQYRAERIVFDRQTAAGSLHSGYPVCGHIGKDSTLAVDFENLKTKGSWGFYHEYGHNHQHSLWALPGTGETTCNLWSVYLYEELVGIHRSKTHRAISPLNRLQTRRKYFGSGANFKDNWSMWTALDTYLLIQEEFGWQPFQTVFTEYNALTPEQRPKNQQQINDQWVIRLSKACGKNLAPYWQIWNLPMTEAVHKELQNLPVWHCPELEKWK